MQFRFLLLLAMVAAQAAICPPICAQQKKLEPLVPREKHPWGKFPVGAWKRMRVTKETFDERGVPTATIYDIKTTVKFVDASGYTLATEQTVEIAGQIFPQLKQEITQGFSGESRGQKVESVDKIGEREVELNGRRIPCEVRKAVMNGDGTTRTTATAYYSADVAPHLLRRELTTAAPAAGEATSTIEEVIALGMPYEFLGQRRAASFVRTVQKQPKQSKEAMEVWCDDVPGGVVAQWSKELDAEGKLISRITLELVGYDSGRAGAAAPAPRARLFDRKRARRADEKMGTMQRRE
ncbi:MAG TPA: hypothetical protein VFB96_10195 [Pirellulaceae bacterium]|nr:hypothetical protein [Pirellulaceae bacterium]